MGTPYFAKNILEKIIDDHSINIKLVITQPDKPVGRKQILTPPPVKVFAQNNNIEVLQPTKLKDNFDLANRLKQISPDAIVVVAYGKILPKELLEIPKYGCINVHASLLPEYRGAAPIHRAILDDKECTGVTIMKMDEGLDTGDILLQEKIELKKDDDIETLYNKLSDLGAKLLIDALKNIENLVPKKQDERFATYAPPVKKEEGKIDWSLSFNEIYNKFRAFKIWPGIYTCFKGKIVKFHLIDSESDLSQDDSVPNGTIVDITDEFIKIKVRDGYIMVKELQIEGGKKMSAKDFVNGYKIKKGDIFI